MKNDQQKTFVKDIFLQSSYLHKYTDYSKLLTNPVHKCCVRLNTGLIGFLTLNILALKLYLEVSTVLWGILSFELRLVHYFL